MTYIALLRGINVGGNLKVAMAELRAMVARLGMSEVRSLLNGGNLVFAGVKHATAELEGLLETREGPELLRAAGRCVYVTYPEGIAIARQITTGEE